MKYLVLMLLTLIWPVMGHTAVEDIHLAPGNVTEVIDGDTLVVDLPGHLSVFGSNLKVRVRGIDTPERRSDCPSEAERAAERLKAHVAREWVVSHLESAKTVVLETVGRDMYFRLLADVKIDGQDLGASLLEAGLALPYSGGTKLSWCGR